MSSGWASEILHFWFEELGSDQWFGSSKATDEAIAERFGELWEDQRGFVADDFLESKSTALAAIILFDQFPRNMFRDSASAFATDHLALQIAKKAVDREYDDELKSEQKQFMYMPFMHSEDLSDQTRSLGLFTALGIETNISFAKKHRDIIEKFGRFPHRNKVLGRETRDDEHIAVEQGRDW